MVTNVLANPDRYSAQHRRTLEADLNHPLDLTVRSGRWFILDGVHRLAKAELLELPAVNVRKVPETALGRTAIEAA